MNKKSVIALAVIVGVLSSLATVVVMSLLTGFGLIPFGSGAGSLSEFSHVEDIIEQYYLHEYDMQDVQDAGLKAMVGALNDPYTVYFTPEEFTAYKQDASGEYFGLGMVISVDEDNGLAKVEYFLDHSAAQEAGIREGDYIISVDGENVTNMSLQEISVLCMGEDGTSLKLGVIRGDEAFEFEIVRRAVNRDMVTYRMLDDGIGYMRIIQFGGNCESLFSEGQRR